MREKELELLELKEFETKSKEPKILYEFSEKRDRFTKHFRTEDNHCIAAVYNDPVHFEQEGEWTEIDNSLELKKDADGSEYFQNRNSRVKVKFSKNTNQNKLVSLEKNGFTIEWDFNASQKGSKAEKTKEHKAAKEFRVKKRENSKKDQTDENQEKLMVTVAKAEGYYEDVFAGIDVHYALYGETLKENIILKSKEAVGKTIVFDIKHKGLNARLQDDGSICLINEEQPEQQIYSFSVPFMYDAAGVISNAVKYELKADKGSSIISVIADEGWLSDEARVFPVVIDPVTETSKKSKDIEDTFVKEKAPDSSVVSTYGSFYVGNVPAYGKCRAFLKFNNLPTIPNGSIIYDARIYIYQYKYSSVGQKSFLMTAHQVTSAWTAGNTTWNNKPSYSTSTLDYAEVAEVLSGNTINVAAKCFNVTRLVRDWYNTGVNNGIMFKAQDESQQAEGVFITSDYPPNNSYGITSDLFPCGVFYYRNVSGLEDYQSYHEQSIGRAGNGYTNDYTGNVVMIHNDTATQGNLLPVGVNHIYNLSECTTDSRMGKGWRLSVMQELKSTGITDFPYVYIDDDGTSHYFYKDKDDGNKLKDEDGLGLTITVTSTTNYDEYRTMETQDKMKYVFGMDGYLRRIKDLNGNVTSFNYGPNDAGNFLGNIVDATGAKIVFNYSSDANKTRLNSITDDAGRLISYSYDSSGRLTTIIYPDGKESKYTYDSNKLKKVTNFDGYSIEYSYNNDFKVPRVSQITERGGTTLGQVLKISYKNGNTTIFEEPGLDGNIDTTSDNQTMTYHFDSNGRPTDVCDQDGNANSWTYFKEGIKNNKLSKAGATQKTVINFLSNPRFNSNLSGWSWDTASQGYVTEDTSNGCLGSRCVKVTSANTAANYAVRQSSSLNTGTYTLSAYVKASNIVTAKTKGAGIRILQDNVLIADTYITGTTDSTIDKGWERLSITFTCTKNGANITALGGIFEATGTAWFDAFQLEGGAVANKFNLINNAGFISSSTNQIKDWSYSHSDKNDTWYNDSVKGNCARIGNSIGKRKYINQGVTVSGSEDDVYSLSGWAKCNVNPGREFRIAAAVIYETGDPIWHMFDCNPNISDWQFVSGTFSTNDEDGATKRKYKAIHVYAFFANQVNNAYFTGMQLIKDDSESYVYDSEGNLINAKSAADKAKFNYNKVSQLTKTFGLDGSGFEYNYSSANNSLTMARGSDGVQCAFTYDSKGNPTSGSAQNTRTSTAVTNGKVYYIRNLRSGKYLDVTEAADVNGTTIKQINFNGNDNQKWRVLDAGDGYQKLVSLCSSSGRALDIPNAVNTEGTNVQLWSDNKTVAQKFKILPRDRDTYQIMAKCTKDKKALMVEGQSTDNAKLIQLATGSDSNVSQQWFFIPVEEGVASDAPKAGTTYSIRVKHSGQYLDIQGSAKTAGTKAIQYYYKQAGNKQFTLQDAGGGYFYLEPVHAPGMVISKSGTTTEGYEAITLQVKANGDYKQHFKFVATGKEYTIVCRQNGAGLDVCNASFTTSTAIIATGNGSSIADNKRWILEACSDRMKASMAYTADGRHVKTMTDARGNVTTYTYDTKNRLLSSTKDANGNTVSLTYESQTDRLESVGGRASGKEIKNTYTYENDRLKSIMHNGFQFNLDYDAFGNPTTTSVGNQVLQTTQYMPKNGPVASITYGNGDMVASVYDKDYQNIEQKVNGVSVCKNKFDSYGNIIEQQDLLNNVIYNYKYDLIDRPLGMNTSHGQTLRIAYTANNHIDYMVNKVKETGIKTQYVYGDVTKQQYPGQNYGVKIDGVERLRYTYDTLARAISRTLLLDQGGSLVTNYEFLEGVTPGTTTGLIKSMTNGTAKLSYTYDKIGNIRTVSENGVLKATYTYDEISQLVREDNAWENKTIVYVYDAGSNITGRQEYPYTTGGLGSMVNEVVYQYNDAQWKDKLTSFNGEEITYDAIGNPLTYRDQMQMTWGKGRQLATLKSGSLNMEFAYDTGGNRIKKTVNEVTTQYYLNGSNIMTQITGNDRLDFAYDEQGGLLGFKYNNEWYYYVKNLQGDIQEIVDKIGNVVVQYSYNSWGKLLEMKGSRKDDLGALNPFRYREYYYDTETELYVTETRYYDPAVGRFINPDDTSVIDGGNDHISENNLFVYCFNNPVNMMDEDGTWPKWATNVVKVGIGALAIGIGVAATVASGGMAAPVLIASIKIAAVSAAVGAGTGAAFSAVSRKVSTGSWKGAGKAALRGAINGAADGFMWGGIAAGATFATAAAKGIKVQKVGRLKPAKKKGNGYLGVQYKNKRGSLKSFEIHTPHKGGPHQRWHWQRNTWNSKTNSITGKSKHWTLLFRRRF